MSLFKNFFQKDKKVIAQKNMLVVSPVYSKKITGTIYSVGELLPHARMKLIYEDQNVMYGTCYNKDETLFFVATDKEVMDHIRKEGAVPLTQTNCLRLFKDKKRMQSFIASVNKNNVTNRKSSTK